MRRRWALGEKCRWEIGVVSWSKDLSGLGRVGRVRVGIEVEVLVLVGGVSQVVRS